MDRKPRTEWNLTLLYRSPQDPAIERDMKEIEAETAAFRKRYAGKSNWLTDERQLLKAINAYERVLALVQASKPALYFWLIKKIDTQNTAAEGKLNKYIERFIKARNDLLFFELSLGELDRKRQAAYVKSSTLEPCRYFLKKLFERSRYNLSEKEERILSLKYLPSHGLWTQGVQKLVSRQTVRTKGKGLPLEQALQIALKDPSAKNRRNLYGRCMEVLKGASEFAESELNAVVINKKIDDDLRGFKNPYDETILGYENDPESVRTLIDTVSKRFKLAHRFYEVKRKLLGLEEMTQADRAAEVGRTTKKITFDEAYEIVKKSLDAAHPRYGELLARMRDNGQLDAFPRMGKVGGAFQVSEVGVPSYILLNHTNDLRSLTTLAHEMGHAIHTERSRVQRPLYQHYTTPVAETASTFFEGLVFEDVIASLSERERVLALHDKVQDQVSTIFRQIAFFNFESELHSRIRSEGALSKEAIAGLFNKHVKSYMGPKTQHTELDGYFFVHVSHFRSFFYVYTYAYGELISSALLAEYRKDSSFIEKIDQFLSAGGSASPEEIFASIGIDTKEPRFLESGLNALEKDINALERLVSGRTR